MSVAARHRTRRTRRSRPNDSKSVSRWMTRTHTVDVIRLALLTTFVLFSLSFVPHPFHFSLLGSEFYGRERVYLWFPLQSTRFNRPIKNTRRVIYRSLWIIYDQSMEMDGCRIPVRHTHTQTHDIERCHAPTCVSTDSHSVSFPLPCLFHTLCSVGASMLSSL